LDWEASAVILVVTDSVSTDEMVDYSKWDHLEVSDEDDEIDDRRRPPVRHVHDNECVTIGPNGYSINDVTDRTSNCNDEDDDDGDWNDADEQAVRMQLSRPSHPQFHPQQQHLRVEEALGEASKSPNAKKQPLSFSFLNPTDRNVYGGTLRGVDYRWSQSQQEVSLWLCLPLPPVPISKKNLFLFYSEQDKQLSLVHCESRVFALRLLSMQTTDQNTEVVFQAQLQFAIALVGDPMNPYDEIIDWHILSELCVPQAQMQWVQLSLRKQSIIAFATHWWDRVFVGEPLIDVTAIPARRSRTATTGLPTVTGSGAVEDPLQEAHRIFLERVHTKEKFAIDIDEDEDEDDKAI
jgi:hypothetical protein